MEVRKYSHGDHDRLVALLKAVFPGDTGHNEPAAVIEAKLKVDDLIYVAETGDHLIGCCMGGYDGVRGWLYSVSVLEEYRREGVGAKLVRAVVTKLKEQGCIKVNLQVRADNTEVTNFYQKLGFKEEDRMSMGVLLS